MNNQIVSEYKRLSPVQLPEFSATRIMMMPVRLGSLAGVPSHYAKTCAGLFDIMDTAHTGKIGYLTVDEQHLKAGQTLRRAGKHVDGYYHGRCGGWGGGGGWGSVGNGMLTLSNTAHCRVYAGTFDGEPGWEGECDHLDTGEGLDLAPGVAHWLDGACVHESLPVAEDVARQFVRLSMPSNGPWFENYTPNPTGVLPSAAVLPARAF